MSTAVIFLVETSTERCRHIRKLINNARLFLSDPHAHNHLKTAVIITEGAAIAQSIHWLGFGLNVQTVVVRFPTRETERGPLFSYASKSAVGPTQRPIYGYPSSFSGGSGVRNEADRSLNSSSSGSLCSVRWFETDVSGLTIGSVFKSPSCTSWPLKMRHIDNPSRRLITQKTEEFSSTAAEARDLALTIRVRKMPRLSMGGTTFLSPYAFVVYTGTILLYPLQTWLVAS